MSADRGTRRGWVVVASYSLACAVSQVVWLTYAPITTSAAQHYGVSESAIGWLANVFPLLFVLLALPAGLLLDRWFRASLVGGAMLTAAGALLRTTGSFDAAVWCALAAAVAQPFLLGAVSKIADGYLPAQRRPLGIAVGAAANVVGMLAALVMGAAFGIERLSALLWVFAVLAGVAALAVTACLLGPAPASITASARISPAVLARLFADVHTRALAGLVFVGFGVFIALTTWLEPLLRPAGIDAAGAGSLLAVMVGAGIVGSVVLPPWVARHHRERPTLGAALVITAFGCVTLALAPSFVTAVVVAVVVGFPLLAALPVVLELTERVVGPGRGSTGASFIYLAGNAGGLVITLVVSVVLDRPGVAFGVLAVGAVAGTVFLRKVPTSLDGSSTSADPLIEQRQ